MLDDEQGGYEASIKLIEKGHIRIGVVAGSFQEYPMRHRLKGYQKAFFENHIFYDLSLLIEGDWERYSGYQAVQVTVHMLQKEPWEELYKVKYRYIERASISKRK